MLTYLVSTLIYTHCFGYGRYSVQYMSCFLLFASLIITLIGFKYVFVAFHWLVVKGNGDGLLTGVLSLSLSLFLFLSLSLSLYIYLFFSVSYNQDYIRVLSKPLVLSAVSHDIEQLTYFSRDHLVRGFWSLVFYVIVFLIIQTTSYSMLILFSMHNRAWASSPQWRCQCSTFPPRWDNSFSILWCTQVASLWTLS
jgi:hypothetical protein